MPKEEIDYSNTIIYTIRCKNPDVKDLYLGYTTNLIQRKYSHKLRYKTNKTKNNFYSIISKNGGWNNWNITEIAKYNCNDNTEAKMKRNLHIEEHKNTKLWNIFYDVVGENVCEKLWCDMVVDNMDNEKSSNYFCKKCDYNTSRFSQYLRHLETIKHKMDNVDNKKVPKHFTCDCGKVYSYKSGLCKHMQKCNKNNNNDTNNGNNNTNNNTNNNDTNNGNKVNKNKNSYHKYFNNNEELLEAILKDNQEFKEILVEQNNKIMELSLLSKNTTIIHNTTNNNNFNLQMFLNVQCKDALNISEFVDSLQPKIEDLETTGRLGYVEGISKIFLNGLQGLDINKRPIHCSDPKRETIYIKDNNIWEKETENKEKLKLAIKQVASKNIKQIQLWQKENPDCLDSSSKKNDKYLKIVSNAMNGLTPEQTQRNYNKIISKLAREVVIQKEG